MSTLRISNIEAKSVPASATIDEKVKITNSSGDPLVFIDGKTSGITTVGINTTDPNITFDANSNVVVTGIITATKFSGQFEPTSVGIADSIFHTGDTDTVIRFPANNQIQFKTNDTERMIIGSSGNITLNNELRIPNAIAHVGDNDTQIRFPEDDHISFQTAGDQRLRIRPGGVVLVGLATASRNVSARDAKFQLQGTTGGDSALSITRNSANANGPHIDFGKSRAATLTDNTVVQNGDALGSITFSGADGTDTISIAAEIKAEVDGTPGSNDMPGRLVFKTTSDGSASPSERLRITSDGSVVIGHTAANAKLQVNSGTGSAVGNVTNPAFQIGDTANYRFAIHTTNEQAIIANKNGDDGIAFHTKTANSGSFGEACRITSAGNLAFTSGNGIDFSATSDSSGMTDELLDDYEEGSWTPIYVGGTGSITVNAYSVQYGKYVKIGKMVYVEGMLRANVTNNSNGNWDLGGLPFTVANTSNASGILHGKEQSSWTVAPDHFSCIPNNTIARARQGLNFGANGYTNGNTTNFNSGSSNNNRIYFAGAYRAEG